MMPARALAIAAACLVVPAISACESTQDKSARLAKEGKGLINVKGVTVTRLNPFVRVVQAAVVQDANGVAAVVRLRNIGRRGEVAVPVAITVLDAAGRKLYANDVPGLDPSLTSLPVLEPGTEALWVDNQIAVTGRAKRLMVRVGSAKHAAPARVPRLNVSGVAAGSDTDGAFVRGTLVNASAVEQRRVAVACVARRGSRVVGAGRGIVDRLSPNKPTPFTAYVIGQSGVTTTCAATPTVLSGGSK
jgi:hypothetical protein